MSALAFLLAAVLVKPAAMAALRWSSEKPFGIVQFSTIPPAGRFVIAFLLMDLTFYWWHIANHRIRFLWRFHNVHHFDPDLDVSTGFRFHFGEVAMSAVFRVAQVAVIGISAPAFASRNRPDDPMNLSAFHSIGLWLAEIMRPPAAPRCRTSKDTAGVGHGLSVKKTGVPLAESTSATAAAMASEAKRWS